MLLAVLVPQEPPAAATPTTTHWAYEAPQPVLPPRDGHPIDAFLDVAIEREGLTPAPEADRATLLRRVSFDLIGLPPTIAELDAFLADTAPDAYEKVVDRLLASPHYGERQAVPWLDLARYADTNGFNFDSPRSQWKWRDWVIDAFNRDLPFDRFTLLQLAGDLLPDAGDEGLVATGFHRNTMLNDEGGVDADEARWERLLDRASTTATVWLGATMQCAQCHDHKYDPISQRDFYAMVAFFEPAAEETQKVGERTSTLILRERKDVPAVTHLRLRGAFDAKGEAVEADVPHALGPPLEKGIPRDRLALARWLVREDHPLVARVHVNRVWGEVFGRALAATPEDLGTQGERPDHPELLDWLARHFVRSGWSQKELLRTIVTSAAYRRATAVDAAQRERDPQNRFLARGSRHRLAAEFLRDQQLAVSGLLARTIGGPSVFPLQADTSGVVPTNKADVRWKPSPGGDRHRRGLYTFWRRTATFVQFAVFDAPSREVCTVRRQRTNTPLQALSALNDPASWEAARMLALRMEKEELDDRARLAHGFRLCTSRQPDEHELDLLFAALRNEHGVRDLTWIANALLNLDEAMSR